MRADTDTLLDLLTQAAAMCNMLEDAAMHPDTRTMPADTVASYSAVLSAIVGKAQAIAAEIDGPHHVVLPSDCKEARTYLCRVMAEA